MMVNKALGKNALLLSSVIKHISDMKSVIISGLKYCIENLQLYTIELTVI